MPRLACLQCPPGEGRLAGPSPCTPFPPRGPPRAWGCVCVSLPWEQPDRLPHAQVQRAALSSGAGRDLPSLGGGGWGRSRGPGCHRRPFVCSHLPGRRAGGGQEEADSGLPGSLGSAQECPGPADEGLPGQGLGHRLLLLACAVRSGRGCLQQEAGERPGVSLEAGTRGLVRRAGRPKGCPARKRVPSGGVGAARPGPSRCHQHFPGGCRRRQEQAWPLIWLPRRGPAREAGGEVPAGPACAAQIRGAKKPQISLAPSSPRGGGGDNCQPLSTAEAVGALGRLGLQQGRGLHAAWHLSQV